MCMASRPLMISYSQSTVQEKRHRSAGVGRPSLTGQHRATNVCRSSGLGCPRRHEAVSIAATNGVRSAPTLAGSGEQPRREARRAYVRRRSVSGHGRQPGFRRWRGDQGCCPLMGGCLGWRGRRARRPSPVECTKGQERSTLCLGYAGQARNIQALIAVITPQRA